MRNRRNVTDGADIESRRSQGTHRRLTAGSWTAYPHIDRTQTMVARLVGGVHGSLLSGKGRAFTRSAEAERTRALPGKRVALAVRDGHDGVVERSLNVDQSVRNVLALALLELLVLAGLAVDAGCFCSCFAIRSSPSLSSCRPLCPYAVPCGYARWCACAGRAWAGCAGGADHDRTECRSAA